MEEKKNEIIKINDKTYKEKAFLIEESHPVIGRILIVGDAKFKILDDAQFPNHKSGTFIKQLTEDDEELMREYDEDLENLSKKLVNKVNLKELIKETIKGKPIQELKTGLYILEECEKGKKIDIEHHKGCYNFKMHLGHQSFELMTICPDDLVEGGFGR